MFKTETNMLIFRATMTLDNAKRRGLGKIILIAAALNLAGFTVTAQEVSAIEALTVEPHTFTANDGTTVQAEKGVIKVPEHRGQPGSRTLSLTFIRFPSTSANPGDPVVYLAGGPGGSGSGTAKGSRFPLFMAMREVADVIAFDQRGTGMSNEIPRCSPETALLATLTRDELLGYYRAELERCFEWWESEGVAIDGYTTLESAHDIEDLRSALGVERLNLWGISYGSHLGFAALKYYPEIANRAVFAGIEGLNETIKRPALTDEYFRRMQERINADPAAEAFYPDLLGLMRRVHQKLNAEPAVVEITPRGSDTPLTVTYDGFAIQLLTASSTADPSGFANLPLLYLALDNGQYELAGGLLYGAFQAQVSSFRGMPEAMDLASGITAERMAQIREEANSSVLGDALNFPMPHIAGIRPEIDLGDSFREGFQSNTPVLLISGTLDGRTYPEASAQQMNTFPNGQRLIVENGGHNIFEADQRVADAVISFFKGETVPASITMDMPSFSTP